MIDNKDKALIGSLLVWIFEIVDPTDILAMGNWGLLFVPVFFYPLIYPIYRLIDDKQED